MWGGVLMILPEKFSTSSLCFLFAFTLLLSGCAFNVISLQQKPTTFQSASSDDQPFSLAAEAKPRLSEGRATKLKANTLWKQVGAIAEGAVYHTKDQVVTVEASNQFEADIVVNGSELVGFYLPVQNTFVAVAKPVTLSINKM